MYQFLGILLIIVIAVMVIRSRNEKRVDESASDDDPDDTPATWEDSEELRYGVHEEEDWSSEAENWGEEDGSGPTARPYIPELDDPDRR